MKHHKSKQIMATSAGQQLKDRESEILADIRRHRVMRGYPPEGPIFDLPSEAENKKRAATLKRFGRRLTKLLAKKSAQGSKGQS
jgi:hypothetical protein